MKKVISYALLTLLAVSALCPVQAVNTAEFTAATTTVNAVENVAANAAARATSAVWDDGVGIRHFSTSDRNTIAVKDDNTLWACGSGLDLLPEGDSRLIDGDILTMSKIMDGVISANKCNWYLMVVRENGELVTRGSNVNGGMGIRDYTGDGWQSYNDFIKIMDDVKEVKTGGAHTLALKNDATLWAWGYANKGQVGNGTFGATEIGVGFGEVAVNNDYITQPQKIMDNVKYFATSYDGSCAITNDGSLWCWGYNKYGQVGDGTTQNQPKPVKVLDSVQKAAMGGIQTMALKTDGSLWAWGNNDRGGLMDGTTENSLVPKKVLDNVIDFSCSNTATCVIKNDGGLYAYGYWRSDFATEYRTELKKVLDSAVIVNSNGGANHMAIMATDGSLYTIGQNIFGRIGDGTYNTDAEMPVKIRGAAPSSSLLAAASSQSSSLETNQATNQSANQTKDQTTDQTKDQVTNQTTDQSAGSKPATTTTASTTTTSAPTAQPTASKVLVNGEYISFDAYSINDSNYFKLRDIAYVLNGTTKQFDVSWDDANNAIILTSGKAYMTVGGEMVGKGSGDKTPTHTDSKIILNGKEVAFTAYSIEGNNYFKLRDIGAAFDFGVDWDDANDTIAIDTGKGYI